MIAFDDVLSALKGLSLDEMTRALERLPDSQVRELVAQADEITGEKRWLPNPGPQTEAYMSQADELFYGGAAGGGKSALLCGLAINEHRKIRLFRREGVQVGGLIDECEKIIGSRDGLSMQPPPVWRLGDGVEIQFAGVAHEHDKSKWQGRARDYIGFDEITEFSESMYRFLIGWNRSTDAGQRCRVVAAGNPPTNDEGMWVVRYWAPWIDEDHPNPAAPGELRWFTTIDGRDHECDGPEPIIVNGQEVRPRSRTFIPARLTDNPDLMRTGYAAVLDAMPEELRERFREGKFKTHHDDDPFQLIPTSWVRAAQTRWREGQRPDTPMTSLGVDPALGGRDDMVIAPRYGQWIDPLEVIPGASLRDGDEGDVLPRLMMMHVERVRRSGAQVNFDSIGIGASLQMALQDNDTPHQALSAGRASQSRDKTAKYGFANLRTEMWWKFRERLDPENGDGAGKGSTWALPPDPQLAADLTAPRYELRGDKYVLESKDKIFGRLGRSTDRGDAVVMAAYTGDARAKTRGGRRPQIRVNSAYSKYKRR